MLDRLILLLTLLLAPCVQAGAGQLTDAAWPVMQRLNAALVRYQCTDPGDSDYGGILCPGCGLYRVYCK